MRLVIGFLALLIAGVQARAGETCPAAQRLINAGTWLDTKAGFDAVRAQCSLAYPAVQNTLIKRYAAENADPNGLTEAKSTSLRFMTANWGETVEKIAPHYHNAAAYRAFIRANFNEDSQFGLWLADNPEAVSYLLEATQANNQRLRDRSITV